MKRIDWTSEPWRAKGEVDSLEIRFLYNRQKLFTGKESSERLQLEQTVFVVGKAILEVQLESCEFFVGFL